MKRIVLYLSIDDCLKLQARTYCISLTEIKSISTLKSVILRGDRYYCDGNRRRFIVFIVKQSKSGDSKCKVICWEE